VTEPAATTDPAVVDNETAHRFEVEVDGHLAELVYRRDGQRLVLVHTGVPDELEGQGIGGRLVRAAVARAADESLTIVPNCPFARGWLEKHPQELTTVAVAW
jgi:predicted GNAT family acetyltransferase